CQQKVAACQDGIYQDAPCRFGKKRGPQAQQRPGRRPCQHHPPEYLPALEASQGSPDTAMREDEQGVTQPYNQRQGQPQPHQGDEGRDSGDAEPTGDPQKTRVASDLQGRQQHQEGLQEADENRSKQQGLRVKLTHNGLLTTY